MSARTQFLLALAGAGRAPEDRAMAREQLADIMPAVAITVEAMNHAHFTADTNDWTMEKSQKFGAAALTLSSPRIQPEKGMYSDWFYFSASPLGMTVSACGGSNRAEDQFDVRIAPEGRYEVATKDGKQHNVRTYTLDTAHQVLEQFGGWMRRNFDEQAMARIQSFVPRVEESKRSLMPQPKTNWFGPFTPNT